MAINLLPWRLAIHHENIKKLFIRISLCLLSSISCTLLVFKILQTEQSLILQKNEQHQRLSQALDQTIEQITALRQNSVYHQEQQSLPQREIIPFLDWLSNLPLQKGELSEVDLTQQKLLIKGVAEDQQEFEQLQHRVEQFKLFKHAQLSQFQPQNSQLMFEFQLKQEHDDYENIE